MREIVYFDFDGTLVNCQKRLYGLFSSMIAPKSIDEEYYWQLRSSGSKQKDILQQQFGYSNAQCAEFARNWLRNIELEEWLRTDRPRENAGRILSALSEEYELILVTHRQSQERLLNEVQRMGFTPYFTDILVTKQKLSKADLICSVHTGQGVLVGDTCEDVRTAHSLNFTSIIIRSEFECWEQIVAYQPSFMISDLSELPQTLQKAFSKEVIK